MIKKILFVLLTVQCIACGDLNNALGTIGSVGGGLTSAQIGMGLKEALNLGIASGADRLSLTDGFFKSAYKIFLPEEAQKVTNTLKKIPGFGSIENEMLKLINRGAEDAAKKAKPIFINAIKQMSFADATNILMGDKNAATSYLNKTTKSQLYKEFNPVIVKSLQKVKAVSAWKDATTAYNKIPFVTKMNPSLDDHVTTMALKGLFSMVEKEERKIRTNVSARSTDLLKQVFAKQDR